MRIIISGGGTGGHLYPALAIADALKYQDSTHEILFVGANGKVEMEQVPKAGYAIEGLPIRGLQKRRIWENVGLPFRLMNSIWQSNNILKKFKPDVVVGTGGYTSLPILYKAARAGIPTLIQEQNAHAGMANVVLSKIVDKVCAAYTGMERYFPARKLVITGNPIRTVIRQLPATQPAALQHFGLAPGKCVLILGGSLGAQTINECTLKLLDTLIEERVQVLWSTGPGYYERVQAQLTPRQRKQVRVYPFIDEMALAYAAANVVVSRAGALAISELCAAQKATIFIPSPNVTANHQNKNVQPLVRQGAALLINDDEAPYVLGQVLLQLVNDKEQQATLCRGMRTFDRPNAVAHIVQEITRLTKT